MRRLLVVVSSVALLASGCRSADPPAARPASGDQQKPYNLTAADREAILNLLLTDPHMTPGLRAVPGETSKGPGGVLNQEWDLQDTRTKRYVGHCSIDLGGDMNWRVWWETSQRAPVSAKQLSPTEAEARAQALAQRLAAVLRLSAPFTMDAPPDQPRSDTDGYHLFWSAPGGGDLQMDVNAFSGKVTAVWLTLRSGPELAPEQQRELRDKAIALTDKYMREHGLGKLSQEMIIHEWRDPGGSGVEAYTWGAEIELAPANAGGADALVQVAGARVLPGVGQVRSFEVTGWPAATVRLARAEHLFLWEAQERLEGGAVEPDEVISDTYPVLWAGGKAIALRSNRHVEGYPSWRRQPQRVCLMDVAGRHLAALTGDPSLYILELAAGREWIVGQAAGWMQLANVKTGAIFRLSEKQGDETQSLSILPDIPRVYGRIYRDVEQNEWRVYTPPKGGSTLVWEAARGMSPRDVSLFLSPSGRRAAVVTLVATRPRHDCKLSLAAVAPDGAIGARTEPIMDVAEEAVVSWFSDEQTLLCTDDRGASVVTVATGAVLPLALGSLLDPDTRQALRIENDSIRACGQGMVLFHATAQGVPPRRGSRVYVARLDGSDLRRLTPLDNTTIPVYRFATGKAAFDPLKVPEYSEDY